MNGGRPVNEIALKDAVRPTKIKAGVYRLAGNMILLRTPGHCLRGVGHNRRGNATKKCFTWKLYKTLLNDAEVIEVLGATNRSLFGAVIVEEFGSKADAMRAFAAEIARQA
jgi:hypothetical protein